MATVEDVTVIGFLGLGNSGGSPPPEFKANTVADTNFVPMVALRLVRKDLSFALGTANELSTPIPLTSFLNRLHQAAIAAGLGDRNFCAIARVFDGLAKAG